MKLFANIILIMKCLSIDCINVDTNLQNRSTIPKKPSFVIETIKNSNSTITHCSTSASYVSTQSSENCFVDSNKPLRKISYAEKLKMSLKHTNKSICLDRTKASPNNILKIRTKNNTSDAGSITNPYINTIGNVSHTSKPDMHNTDHIVHSHTHELDHTIGNTCNKTSSNFRLDKLQIVHDPNNCKNYYPVSNSKPDNNQTDNNNYSSIENEMSENDIFNIDINISTNEKLDNNIDVSMDKTIFNNNERVAIGYELIPDIRPNRNKKKYPILKSISIYNESGYIYHRENIEYPQYLPRDNGIQVAKYLRNPHSIRQVQKDVKKIIENKLLVVHYAVDFMNQLLLERITLPLWYIRDVACLTKFIDILARSYYNSNDYKTVLEDTARYLLNKKEQSYIKKISRSGADWRALASWVLYDKLKIEWESDVYNLMSENNYKMDQYPEERYKSEAPHRGLHCDHINKYTLRALSPALGIYNTYIDFEIDSNKKVKQVTFTKFNGETDEIIIPASTRNNETFHNNEPWLLKKRKLEYYHRNIKLLVESKILRKMKNNIFIVHQPATDLIKYRIISRGILQKYSKHFIDLRALLRARGIPEADSKANLKDLAEKYLHHHYEPDVELDGVARAAICGQLFKLYRFETKPKVNFYDWKSGKFALKIE